MAIDEDLSVAVVVFFGWGTRSWPHALPEAVISRFGREQGGALVDRIEAIRREPWGDVDWSSGLSLVDGVALAERRLVELHPELSQEAITAFGWDFGFTWR